MKPQQPAAQAHPPTPPTGLSSEQAHSRLIATGPNQLFQAPPTSAWVIFLRQFKGAMVYLLIAAGVVSGLIGEWIDSIAIGAIVVLNAVIGFMQEFRADRAVLALRAMTAPHARVRRDGHTVDLPAVDIVPGDHLILEAGDIVAADARLLEAHRLTVDEAPLTGESVPVLKRVEDSAPDAPLAERVGSVFMGTTVVDGSGQAEVIATGMASQVGRIAHLLSKVEQTRTPLQDRLDQVGRTLLLLCVGIVGLVALLGLVHGRPWSEVLLGAVSLAVAAVPEGLGAVVTVALALGVQRLAKRGVLVRNLPSVETLGCTTVICTDKTGTLTEGVMAVREVWGPDRAAVLFAAAACSDALLGDAQHPATGDSTEIALLQAAAAEGIHRADIEAKTPRTWEDPFDSDRKLMAILRSDGVLYVKGALEGLLALAAEVPEGLEAAADRMANQGLRVLAVATGSGKEETELTLLGLTGLADPPRESAAQAIAQAKTAGITTVMITGDHPRTATAIARELGLLEPDQAPEGLVYARATPEDKMDIINSWRDKGNIVAMTGDGVNDAPALREAHIGIAMGRSGTEVAREAADMILTDDDYASIIAAVEEGRGVYENIRKSLVYLLTGNVGELTTMLAAAAWGLPVPLLPLHLLWINLVTDGLPALALVMDPTDPDALNRPPREPDEPILGKPQWKFMLSVGLLEGALVTTVFVWATGHGGLAFARDMVFTTLVSCQMLRAFSARSTRRTLWGVGALSNLPLIAVVLFTFGLQVLIHVVPALREIMHLTALPLSSWLIAVGLGFIPVSLLELRKLLPRS